MSEQFELPVSTYFPTIYQINLESFKFNDVLETFCEEVLQNCSYTTVESAQVDYITSVIEPIGWQAVWRSTKQSSIFDSAYDFNVEVVNVSLEKLEADVIVHSIISSNPNIDFRTLTEIRKDVPVAVPLIELYTVSEGDEDELYLKTAIAIEYVRVFQTHLQRPWDGEDDVKYTEDVLKPRLHLYFDMKNNILPKAMVSKIKVILKQAAKVEKELKILFSEMNVSDSEAEINEDDFMHSMSLKEKLSELQTKMEMLENPVIRSFVNKKYSPGKTSKRRHISSDGQIPVTYVVAKQFTYDMIANLSVDTSTLLEFEHNPETAFKCCSAGDKIIIFPGIYQCDTLGWMEEQVLVQGIGLPTDIVLEATGNSDVFFNSCARNVELQNLTLKAKKGLLSAIVVHHGKIHLKNCIIDSNKADIGILLLGGAESTLENCTVCNAKEDGLLMKSLSSLSLHSSKIELCDRYGIQVDAENEYSTESFTELVISDSQMIHNGSYGIFFNNVPLNEISLQRPHGDFSILKLFPWLRYDIQNATIKHNGENGVGVSSSFKNSSKAVPKIDSITNALPKPEELNYSALSELLNAVNMSMELETQHLYN